MICLNTDKYSTLQLKLNSLLSPVGTLDELSEFLEMCYDLRPFEKKDIIKDLVKLQEMYLAKKETYVHSKLIENFISILKNEKYIDSKYLFNTFYRLVQKEDDWYVIKNVLVKYELISTTEEAFKSFFDPNLTEEENIHLYLQTLSDITTEFILDQYIDVPHYMIPEFLSYCVYTYLKEYFIVDLKLTDKLTLESITLNYNKA